MFSQRRTDIVLLIAAVICAVGAVLLVGASGTSRLRAQEVAAAAKENGPGERPKEVRVGYFPNVTHAQALIGSARGDFQRALGSDIKLTTVTFNAGPSVIEALYAGHLDIAYVGPSPTINGFLRSDGDALRVVSGAANNGILVIGSKKRGITRLDQLPGRRIATPQFANTQDISAKAYLTTELGAKLKDRGGDTDVFPMANPDIEILMEKGQIDAAWVPEPWGSRMIDKGLANLIAEEKDLWPSKRFTLTSVIARTQFLEQYPDLVQKFLEAHVRITDELHADAAGFAPLLNEQLKKLTGKTLPTRVILNSLKHTEFTTDPAKDSYARFFEKAKALRLVKGERLDVDKLVDTRALDAAIAAVSAASPDSTLQNPITTSSQVLP